MNESASWTIPLWEHWNKDALVARQGQIGERAFNRGFRQMALSDKERTFPAFDQCLVRNLEIESVVDVEWGRYVGVDPSTETRPGTCIFVISRAPDGKRYVLHIEYGAWKPDQVADRIITINNEYMPQAIFFENNALQGAYISLVKLRGGHDIPIRGFMTGKQKSDPMVGLPSLQIEFENKAWVIPDPEHQVGCGCHIHRWFKEMRSHPLYETSDGVMAAWFAREASKLGMGVGIAAANRPIGSRWIKQTEQAQMPAQPTTVSSNPAYIKGTSRWRR